MATKSVKTTKQQPPLISSLKINGKALWIVVTLVVVIGIYAVTRLYAASGTMTLVPSTTSVNLGATVTVAVRVNSGTDPVNAVEANLAFDSTKLQYVSVSETGTAFGLVASTTPGTGTLQLARAVQGGSAAVTGDQLVTTVTFKAIAAGSVPITIAAGSALVRSTDNTDILVAKNGTTLTLADTAAPSVPVGLASSGVTMTGLTVTWTVSTDNVGVTGYRVYRNGTQVGTPVATSYTDTGFTPATAYQYKVAAIDAAGNLSAQSTALSVTTLADTAAPTVPGAPTSPSQTMTSINLAWTVSTDNIGVTGYRVYRNGLQVASVASNTYVDSGLTANTTYGYSVAAIDAAANLSAQSVTSNIKTLADTQAPGVPTGLTGSSSGLSVSINWNAATDNVAVALYVIFMDGVQQATTTATVYTLSGVAPGSHVFTVAARDAAGNTSLQSTSATITVYQTGDGNHDGKVDVFDLSSLLAAWSATGTNAYDLNGDGVVNVFDLSVLLSRWTG